jgi:hypothetical protein
MSTTSHMLPVNFAFTTSFFCSTHIILQLLYGSLSPGSLSSCDVAFDNSAIKYVGEAPARRVALPETPVGQGRFPRGHRFSPVRASGKMVRGRSELGPDPQEHLQDTRQRRFNKRRRVGVDLFGQVGSRIGQAWFLLVLSWGAFWAFVASGSR